MIPLVAWLLIVIVILLGLLYSTFFIPTWRQILLMRKLPGPIYPPVLGLGYELPFVQHSELLAFIRGKVIEGYNRVCGIWLIGLPMVFINDPKDIEVILSSTKHIEKGREYIPLQPWLQEGLLTSKGKKWQTRRKLLTPTFHFKILEDKSQTICANAQRFADKLLEEQGRPFDPTKKISSCTLDVICVKGMMTSHFRGLFVTYNKTRLETNSCILEAAMGVTLNSQDHQSTDYVSAIGRMTKDVVYRVMNLYLHRQWLWEMHPVGSKSMKDVHSLHDFTNKIINERRAVYLKSREDNYEDDTGAKKRPAFLDRLLELDFSKESQLTDSDIREEVDTFMFEGHDTTAACILYALFELGHNPDVQELAFKEQMEIFGEDSRTATLPDLQRMNYLERVIKETLRLYPSVPYISRKLNEDVHFEGIPVIPQGSNVVITPYYLHRQAEYFPDPWKFDPDRFLPDECAKRHPFAYIPFSAGPRNCIGQKFAMVELKVILSTVLRRTRIEAVTCKSEMQLAPMTILRSLSPMYICVLPRQPRD